MWCNLQTHTHALFLFFLFDLQLPLSATFACFPRSERIVRWACRLSCDVSVPLCPKWTHTKKKETRHGSLRRRVSLCGRSGITSSALQAEPVHVPMCVCVCRACLKPCLCVHTCKLEIIGHFPLLIAASPVSTCPSSRLRDFCLHVFFSAWQANKETPLFGTCKSEYTAFQQFSFWDMFSLQQKKIITLRRTLHNSFWTQFNYVKKKNESPEVISFLQLKFAASHRHTISSGSNSSPHLAQNISAKFRPFTLSSLAFFYWTFETQKY